MREAQETLNKRRPAAWLILKALGSIQILVGLVAAYYGPLEIYAFFLFSDGGPFHYDGFGVGSFWFAILVMQNLSYYLLAFILLPLGLGTLLLRRWALTLSTLCLWGWMVGGTLLIFNLLVLAPSLLPHNGEAIVGNLALAGAGAFLLLIILPGLLLFFFNSGAVKTVFAGSDPNTYWTESYPFPLLALLFLGGLGVIALHLTIFFQAVFPWFGRLMLGRQPVYYIALEIVILVILMYGMARLQRWAWWGAMLYVSALFVSGVMTFSKYGFHDIIDLMSLPPNEVAFFARTSLLRDYSLVWFFAPPLLLILGLLASSRRYFFDSVSGQ